MGACRHDPDVAVKLSGVDGSDWRLTNQDRYLRGVALSWRSWRPSLPPDSHGDWDHDHCGFCWVHFADRVLPDDPETQLAGYVTDDGLHWICQRCFEDFKDRFAWVVVQAPE